MIEAEKGGSNRSKFAGCGESEIWILTIQWMKEGGDFILELALME